MERKKALTENTPNSQTGSSGKVTCPAVQFFKNPYDSTYEVMTENFVCIEKAMGVNEKYAN